MRCQLVIFCLFFVMKVKRAEEEGTKSEELPTPLPYRGGPRRPPDELQPYYRPRSSVADNFVQPSKYDDYYSKSDPPYDNYVASSSEYGSHASDSGYGHSCSSGYVNASAVALLAFLFLLNLVQDIIHQVNENNEPAERKKREIEDSFIGQIISKGGLDQLHIDFPQVVISLMDIIEDISNNDSEGRSGRKKRSYSTKEANNDSISRVLSLIENGMISDFYQEAPSSILTFLGTALEESDNQISSSCVALSFCSFSARMTYKFGTIGQIVSKLVTNVASRLLTTPDGKLFGITQEASKYGRLHKNCENIQKNCTSSEYFA